VTLVIAHAVRSGIAALNVVAGALADPRTRHVEVVYARGVDEIAAALDAPRAVAIAREAGCRPNVDFLFGLPGEDDEDRRLTIALAERIAAAGARVHSHAFMPLPGTPLAGAAPTQISDDVAQAVARLESRGAAYGQWRKQAGVADQLVALRRSRPRLPRA